MDKLLQFISDHKELIESIPGAAEGLVNYLERLLLGSGETDPQKRAHLEVLVSELRSIAADYRNNPPPLPA